MDQPALKLTLDLCKVLAAENIRYCHWKSNNAIDRSASGENDLDLLVDRTDAVQFAEILNRLGFKKVLAPPDKRMPGVVDYLGYDPGGERLIHVHAHFKLIIGHDMSKNYHLQVEKAYLDSAFQGEVFKLPAPEFEYIVLIIRLVLKYCTWDAILGRQNKMKASEKLELEDLGEQVDSEGVYRILSNHFPYFERELFDECRRALNEGASLLNRIRAAENLQTTLRTSARHSVFIDVFLKAWRRGVLAVSRRIGKAKTKYQFENGGAMIAFIGGDGSGKSTAIKALSSWLSKNFYIANVHMGKPKWSGTTILIRTVLKIGQLLDLYPLETTFDETLNQQSFLSPGYPFLIREVCRARDRYWTYVNARRMTHKGYIVFLDRLPIPKIQIMDGPQVARFVHKLAEGPGADLRWAPRESHPLVRFLVKLEEGYYRQIVAPEITIVLRIDPEIAVKRKPEENADMVRRRSEEIMAIDWEGEDVHLFDSGEPLEEVQSAQKDFVWTEL